MGDRSTLYRGEDIESSIAKKMTPWASTMASLWVSKGDLLVFLMQMTFLRSPRFKTVVKFPLTFLGVFFRNLSQVLWLSRSVSANPEVTAISTLLLAVEVKGHGWMTMPPARNAVAGDKNGDLES